MHPPSGIIGTANLAILIKECVEISIACAKPSAEHSSSPPSRSFFGANAIECTKMSMVPQCCLIRSNTASSSPAVDTFSGMKTCALSSCANGSTYGFALSFRYVTASSAPSSWNALAQPYAIECSLAIPTTSARLPSRTWCGIIASLVSVVIMSLTSQQTQFRILSCYCAYPGLTELSNSLRHLRLFRSDRLVDARVRQELVDQSQESVPIRGRRKQNWECLERLFWFTPANDFLLADIELPLPRRRGRQEIHVLLQDLLHKFHAFQGQRNFLPVQQKCGARHSCGIPAFGYGPQNILYRERLRRRYGSSIRLFRQLHRKDVSVHQEECRLAHRIPHIAVVIEGRADQIGHCLLHLAERLFVVGCMAVGLDTSCGATEPR